MTPLVRKQVESEVMPEAGKPVSCVISTGQVDRDGDSIDPNGWDLSAYTKNPVVLFAHDREEMPVAKAQNCRVEDGKLKAEIVFAPTDDGAECEALVRGGFLNALSVGFRPLSGGVSQSETGGLKFTRQELCEISFVPVPSNTGALVESRSAREEIIKSLSNAADRRTTPQAAAQPEEKQMPEKNEAAAPVAAPAPTFTQEQVDAIAEKAATAACEKMSRTVVTDPSAAAVSAAAGQKAPAFVTSHKHDRAPALEKDGGRNVARSVLAYAYALQHKGMIAAEAAKHLGFVEVADAMDREAAINKALGESTISAGADFIPMQYTDGFYEALAAEAVIRPLIPATSMLNGVRGSQISAPGFTSLPTTTFLGEAAAPANSTPATELRTIDLKWMATEVIIGRDWLTDNKVSNVDAVISAMMARSAALREDPALVEGKGTESEFRGIKLWAGNTVAATATPALADMKADLSKLKGYLEDNNVKLDGNCAFVGAPKHFRGLADAANGLGAYPFEEEMTRAKTLAGHKFAKSSQFSTSGAASAFYLGNFGHCFMANGSMEIEEDTSFVSGGTTHAAKARRQLVLRLWRRVGFVVTHPNAFAYLSTCTWGA